MIKMFWSNIYGRFEMKSFNDVQAVERYEYPEVFYEMISTKPYVCV